MYILTKEEVQKAEEFTIKNIGISELILMENAGQKMVDELTKLFSTDKKISIFCGSGNNGGDGFVVARKLYILGYFVNLIILVDEAKIKNSAYVNFQICKNLKINILSYKNDLEEIFINSDVIVDAIFGIGFKGSLKSPFDEIINKINLSKAKVVSLDIPSGVYANENKPAFGAVIADYTFTVSFLKRSCVLYPSKKNYGKIVVVESNIVTFDLDAAKSWTAKNFQNTFIKRHADTNKSKEGKVLIVGGSDYMPGAVILTSKACFNAGAGLVVVATTSKVKDNLTGRFLEPTYVKTKEKDGVLIDFELDETVNAVACGPGLSRNSNTKNVVKKCIQSKLPIILDADALFFLDDELINLIKKRKAQTVLTPHNKEMARLCNSSVDEIEDERFLISKQKAKEWKVHLVLKGPHTIVTTPNAEQFVNFSGNAGLAKGGSGDVLTGIMSAYISKYKNFQHAVSNSVYLHGKIADFLLNDRKIITPSSLIDNLNLVYKLTKIF